MFLKLFKYDFYAVIKKIVFYYIGLLALAVFSKISILIFKNTTFSVISFFPTISFFICAYMGFLVPIILCMVRYYKNMLSDEGYLTHTLPVKKSSILMSKIVSTLAIEMVTLFVVMISFMIYSFEFIPKMGEEVLYLLQQIEPNYRGTVYGIITLVIVELICAAVFQVTQVAMCLTLGAAHNKSKLVMAFLYYIGINFAIQMIMGVFTAVAVISGNVIFKNFEVGMYLILTFSIVMTIIGIAITYIVNLYCLKKRLNLE